MLDSILPEIEPQIQPRNPYPVARPGPIPDARLNSLFDEKAPSPSLVRRAESSSTTETASATFSCGPNDNSGPCEKYYNASGSGNTVPIVLGTVLPLGIAIIILLYLHRRHVLKLRQEDANDKHKSLDFGMGEGHAKPGKKNKRQRPEMTMAANKEMGGPRHDRGLSLDLEAHNPYLLPPTLSQSRESLHSLSRSITTGDDKYRATNFIPDDGSIRPASSLRSALDDSSSTFTGSSSRRFNFDSKHNLLHNAQDNPLGRPSHSGSVSSTRDHSVDPVSGMRKPLPPPNVNLLAPSAADPARDSFVSTTSSTGAVNALRASNNYLAQFISGGASTSTGQADKKTATATVAEIRTELPAEEVRPPPPAVIKDGSHHGDISPPVPVSQEAFPSMPSITVDAPLDRQLRLPQLSSIDSPDYGQSSLEPGSGASTTNTTSPANTAQHSTTPSADLAYEERYSEYDQYLQHNGFDQYTENYQTEPHTVDQQHQHEPAPRHTGQTHYDETDDYYDEDEVYGDYYQEHDQYSGYDVRRSMMGMRPLPPDDPTENPEDRANRIRSFYKEYFDESNKPQHFAPPPGPQGGYWEESDGYYDNYGPDGYYDQSQYYPPRGGTAAGSYGRHRATVSNGSYMSGPRAYSSVSGRYGQGAPRPAPKKREVPLKTLAVLPTPHLLKDDTFLPIDFAPPKKYMNQRAGTPDSLRGGERPYSPSVRAHVPLASSFDDLAMIPSPHQLRKSSTFTALDFAPPKFRANDTMSETGSIRSNRSGVSAVHAHNIRNGAYRVSRIPKDVGGTREEFAESLRPQWNLNR